MRIVSDFASFFKMLYVQFQCVVRRNADARSNPVLCSWEAECHMAAALKPIVFFRRILHLAEQKIDYPAAADMWTGAAAVSQQQLVVAPAVFQGVG